MPVGSTVGRRVEKRGARGRVYIHGAGKVGRALAKALGHAKYEVTVRPARKGLPKTAITADLIVLAVRDRDLAPLAESLATSGLVPKRAVCVHVAGAVDASPLAPLRAVSRGVAQMHPMISFASTKVFPTLTRGNLHVQGDPAACAVARRVGRDLGMTPRTVTKLDTVGYHAAAAYVANGAAALAAMGEELLVVSGFPRKEATKALGPLLRSVAENVERLGFPASLTGPVRRGDAGALERHAKLLAERLPGALPLYFASAQAQLPLARAIAEAPASHFDAIDSFLKGK